MTDRPLAGLRVAITGAARGIGLATTRELLARGAQVVLGDIDETTVRAIATTLGPDAVGRRVDVSDESSFAEFLSAAEAAFGPPDVVINNAGIMPIGPFLDVPGELNRRAVEVNVLGCINGMRGALPGMLSRGSGHIVNVSSTAGRTPVPGGVTYCATKAAVCALTETARVEYADTGVSFTCVMPNFTNTELIAGTSGMKLIPTVEPEAVARAIADAIATRRPDVWVPRMVGPILRGQPLLGRRIRDTVNRRLGSYDTFLTYDHHARAGYDERIAKN